MNTTFDMKSLNIKKMAKDMTLRDKAKLLFADRNLRGDTEGKERLLTSEEEDAIVKDCQEKHQIDELNRLNSLYNLSIFAMIDVQTNTLRLKHALTRIHFFSMSMYLKGRVDDASLSERASKSLGAMYDLFSPSDEEPEFVSQKDKVAFYTTREPNTFLQKFYATAVECCIDLKKALYTVEHIIKLANMDFLHTRGNLQVAESKAAISDFEEDDGIFKGFLEIYRQFIKMGLMRSENFEQPTFLALLTTSQNLTFLSDAEKSEVEKQVQRQCDRDLF